MRQQQYLLGKSCQRHNIYTTICLKTADIWAQQQYRDISVPCLVHPHLSDEEVGQHGVLDARGDQGQ